MTGSLMAQQIKQEAPLGVMLKTPLYDLHRQLGAKMVPFAGYEMPIHYPTGIVAEHIHTRNAAGLFDVSHMGVVEVYGDRATEFLESIIPIDLKEMSIGQIRYGLLMLETGGVLDDLLITRQENGYLLVINASRKQEDIDYLKVHLWGKVQLNIWDNPVILALQGPKAAEVLSSCYLEIVDMPFMTAKTFGKTHISRTGYTGEDGFEILVTSQDGISLAQKIMQNKEVKPIGLGARDSLRLEAGLCLYGHELTESISPIEAGLAWSIGKRRRQEGGCLGMNHILHQLEEGPARRRVGLSLLPGSIPREGAEIHDESGNSIGFVSSGGHSPSLGHPIAMGYVNEQYASLNSKVFITVRSQEREAKVVKLPFVPHSYFKNKKEEKA
jgi:aminomethyltransferase